jgi:hypothetical protein
VRRECVRPVVPVLRQDGAILVPQFDHVLGRWEKPGFA